MQFKNVCFLRNVFVRLALCNFVFAICFLRRSLLMRSKTLIKILCMHQRRETSSMALLGSFVYAILNKALLCDNITFTLRIINCLILQHMQFLKLQECSVIIWQQQKMAAYIYLFVFLWNKTAIIVWNVWQVSSVTSWRTKV